MEGARNAKRRTIKWKKSLARISWTYTARFMLCGRNWTGCVSRSVPETIRCERARICFTDTPISRMVRLRFLDILYISQFLTRLKPIQSDTSDSTIQEKSISSFDRLKKILRIAP